MLIFILLSICPPLIVSSIFFLQFSLSNMIVKNKPTQEAQFVGERLLIELKQQQKKPAKSLQSCLTLCDPIDGSPPGSTVPGILQARTLEWVAISFSTKKAYLYVYIWKEIHLNVVGVFSGLLECFKFYFLLLSNFPKFLQ